MRIKSSVFGLSMVLLLPLFGGCKKSNAPQPAEKPDAKPQVQTASVAGTVARVHWLGKKRIADDMKAAGLMAIWRLPESGKLEASVLDKLALWMAHGGKSEETNRFQLPSGSSGGLSATNLQATLIAAELSTNKFRPLLDDLVKEECYFEMRSGSNAPPEFVLALRLNAAREALWQTNLAAGLEASLGTPPAPTAAGQQGWHSELTNGLSGAGGAQTIDLRRVGDWTLLGLGPRENKLLTDVAERIRNDHIPFSAASSNSWLEGELDLAALLGSAVSNALPELPTISFAISGNGENVVSRGHLTFRDPLPFAIEPWNIPTNLIHGPLQSFTAVQGLKHWLASCPEWQHVQAGDPPNQLFTWSQSGAPFLLFAAAPLANASNSVGKLGGSLMSAFNPVLGTNRMGKLEPATNFNGLAWSRAPLMNPFLESLQIDNREFLLAGLTPNSITNVPLPIGPLRELFGKTNVMYYESEITGPRVEAWMYISQLFRIVFRRLQLPGDSPAIAWFKAAGPQLRTSTSFVTKTGPAELSFDRESTVGFTALELHVLADWFESPRFPLGLHSVLAQLPPPPLHPRTNPPAAPRK